MLYSLALIFLVGISAAEIFKKIKLPRIIGMFAAGIILGPFVLNLIDGSVLAISEELRKIALVIILIKAGLSLNLSDLKKVGRPALLMSFLPALFEFTSCVIFAPIIFDVTRIEAAIIGSVLAAVSPAVVVPKMVDLIENKIGTEKGIPQLILAGASMDDIFVLVLFSSFTNAAQSKAIHITDFAAIPVSVILGILLGCTTGILLYYIFESCCKKGKVIRNSLKVLIILSISFLLVSAESLLKEYVSFSGLLAAISMAMMLAIKNDTDVTARLSDKFGKLWIAFEIILFVLVGASVDISYTLTAGVSCLMLIAINLCFRSVGVMLCLVKTPLNMKERLFCIISYLPKATVQAAIGAVPLSMGLDCGKLVLSIAVTAIIITAPLGAVGMDLTYKKLLY